LSILDISLRSFRPMFASFSLALRISANAENLAPSGDGPRWLGARAGF
jgi:hypothetical protein